jgi:hypothetical protein
MNGLVIALAAIVVIAVIVAVLAVALKRGRGEMERVLAQARLQVMGRAQDEHGGLRVSSAPGDPE